MIRETTANDPSIAAQLHALCQAAYLVEADRIDCASFPPLRESVRELQSSSDRFLVFEQSLRFIGALSFVEGDALVTITRLVVSPENLRQGIGMALLAEFERRLAHGLSVSVTTAEANLPAVRLYQRMGYEVAGLTRSPEGIPLIELRKMK